MLRRVGAGLRAEWRSSSSSRASGCAVDNKLQTQTADAAPGSVQKREIGWPVVTAARHVVLGPRRHCDARTDPAPRAAPTRRRVEPQRGWHRENYWPCVVPPKRQQSRPTRKKCRAGCRPGGPHQSLRHSLPLPPASICTANASRRIVRSPASSMSTCFDSPDGRDETHRLPAPSSGRVSPGRPMVHWLRDSREPDLIDSPFQVGFSALSVNGGERATECSVSLPLGGSE